jgi:hypothetical protein
LLAALVPLLVLLAWTATARAETASPETRARTTAAQLLERVGGKLGGATAGDPLLVRRLSDRGPAYIVVPVLRQGRPVGLVGVSADGRSWQWYTDSYDKPSFPPVPEGQARQKLGGEVALLSGPDNKLYWSASRAGSTDRLLSADNISRVRTVSDLRQAPSPAAQDARADSYLDTEAKDPARPARLSAQAVAPTSANLSMPHYYQVTNYYCGPASLQMVFGYFRPVIESQYHIAAVMNAKDWGTWRGAYASDLVRAARFSILSKDVQNFGLTGYKERQLGYAPLSNYWSDGGTADPDYPTRYTDLKALVASGHPVLLLMWYSGTHATGHFRVLKGYDDATGEFLVHDPWYSSPYYGPDVHFKQTFLVDDLWTLADRWAAIAEPWRVRLSAPSTVSAGSTFTVSATIYYNGPHPMEGRSPVTASQATLQAPEGFTVDAPTQSLTALTASGTSQTLSWTVTAPATYGGDATFSVAARGTYSGSSPSYPDYTDYIGGVGQTSMQVTPAPTGNHAPTIGSLSPLASSSLPDDWRTLVATYTDTDGGGDLRSALLLVNGEAAGGHALYASYSAASNTLYLRNAENTDWLPGVAPGSPTVLDNGYARLDAARTTVQLSGDNLVVSWAVAAREPMSGHRHNVYLQAMDRDGAITPWDRYGEWLVNRPPVAGPVTGAGALAVAERDVALTSSYSDPDGLADVQGGHLLLNTRLAGAGAVWVRYESATRRLWMRNKDNTSWSGPITPGSADTIDNGRALLDGARTRVWTSGGVLYVRWGLRFHQPFSGRTYGLYTVGLDGASSELRLPWISAGQYSISAMPAVLPLTPSTGRSAPDVRATHSETYDDPDGAAGMRDVYLLVNTRTTGVKSVYTRYDAVGNKLYLQNDAGTGWLGGLTPGSAGTISNSQAVLYPDTTTVSRSGTKLIVGWSIAYKPPFSGRQFNVYAKAEDVFNLRSGWRTVGQWIVDRPPTTVSISPRNSSSTAGATVAFTAAYADPDGAANLASVAYIVNTSSGAAGGLSLRYDADTNKLWLRKADLSGWMGGVAPGSATTLSTEYGSLDVAKTTVTRSGSTLTVRWTVSFTTRMKGLSLNQYMSARDLLGAVTGNVAMGAWTVK